MNKEEKEAINKVLKEQIDSYEKYYVGSEEILPNISEDYKMSKTILNYIEKLQKENTELKKDISNMYNKEVVISIICDNFNVTRSEVLEMLGEDE